MFESKQFRILVLLIALLTLASCGSEENSRSPLAPESTAAADPQAEYQALQKAATEYTYELAVTGEIDVAAGGTVRGNPASWPEGSGLFAYTIPAGAVQATSLPDPGANSVEIAVWVPVYASTFPDPDAAMPMILEPHGLTYNAGQEATLSLSYHPLLTPAVDAAYAVYCIDEAVPEAAATGFLPGPKALADLGDPEDDGSVLPDYGDPFDEYVNSTKIRAAIPHHSRWAVDKTGDEDD